MAGAGFEGPLWSAEKVIKFAQNRQRTNKLGARTLGARSGGSKSGKFMILIAILQYLEAKIVYAPFIIFNHWGHTIIHKNVKLF